MILQGVHFPDEAIAQLCRRFRVARLALFGSILGDSSRPFTAASDVDMLAEFEADAQPTLLTLGRLEHELSQLIGREVDLRTPMDLSQHFRARVVASSRTLHAA